MARRIGKAWGNALGGYKLQNRVGGKFASGFSGLSKGAKKSVSSKKRKSTPGQRRADYLESKAKRERSVKRKKTAKKVATTAVVVGAVGGAAYVANKNGNLSFDNRQGPFGKTRKIGATLKVKGSSATIGVKKDSTTNSATLGASLQSGPNGAVHRMSKSVQYKKGQTAVAPIPATKVTAKGRDYVKDVVRGASGAATVASSAVVVQKSIREMSAPQQVDQHGLGRRNEIAPQPMASSRSLAETIASRTTLELPEGNGVHDPRAARSRRTTVTPRVEEEPTPYDGLDFDPFDTRASNTRHGQAIAKEIDDIRIGPNALKPKKSTGSAGQKVSIEAGDVRYSSPQARRHATSSKSRYSGVVQLQPDTRIITIDTAALKGDQDAISRAMSVNQLYMTPEELYARRRMERKAAQRSRKAKAAQNPKSAAKNNQRHVRKAHQTNWAYVPPEDHAEKIARAASAARDASARAGHYRYGAVVPGDVNLTAGRGATMKPLKARTPTSQEALKMWEDILQSEGLSPVGDKTKTAKHIPYGHGQDDVWKVQRR